MSLSAPVSRWYPMLPPTSRPQYPHLHPRLSSLAVLYHPRDMTCAPSINQLGYDLGYIIDVDEVGQRSAVIEIGVIGGIEPARALPAAS